LQLESPADLYALACNQLARTLEVRAIILRLTQDKPDVQGSPEVLAHHSTAPSPEGEICFSRRALTAARAQDQPVVALSQPGAGSGLQLPVSEGQAPRAVFAAQLNRSGDALDLLYIDMPQERFSDSLFAFIAAVARQISFVQMSLFLAELESKEAALRRANDELKEQDRIKDEYVFRITHDIKGHLGAIQSCLSIADVDAGIGDAEQRNEFVKRASNRAVELLAFITDLLRLTRLRLSGEIAMTRFPLEAVLIKSVATVTPQAEAKGIRLESDLAEDLGSVTGDELSITEVVTNLLFNAIKYTPDGGAITLRARSVGGRARIDVEDSGIGIPADELGRVFEEFFRASNAADFAKEGTGLGLALAKQIVDRHGGIMSAMNNPERGATFTVELRLEPLAP
ncbi:MAG: HAMP domain-containing histidine kinase, partial [bacterium]|nr:HAMP domain-containing histidine kinase [bacterium]